MARILVVGATGQLGGEVVRRAAGDGRHRVRALVRTGSAYRHLPPLGAELWFGDLKDKPSLLRACDGVDTVVATATVVFPRGRYSFEDDERIGYRNLVEACVDRGVGHVVYISLAVPFEKEFLDACPTYRMKLACEDLLRASPLRHTILRCTPFMDDYFALIGSRIPLREAPTATLCRATGATRAIRRLFGRSIDSLGIAFVPGPAGTRHAFIAVADVGAFVLAAIERGSAESATLEIGGPEVLSWRAVCDLYQRLLGHPVRVLSVPPALLRVLSFAARRFSAAFANQLAILWILGIRETVTDAREAAERYAVRLTTAREFLEEKKAARP